MSSGAGIIRGCAGSMRQLAPHREPVARRDWSSQAGAHEQAEDIRQYWQAQGFWVVVEVTQRGKHPRDGLFGLKSNLIGGLPPS